MDSTQIEAPKGEAAVGAQCDAELAFGVVVFPGVVEHPRGGAGHRGGEWIQHLRAMLVLARFVEPPHRRQKQSIPLVRCRIAGVEGERAPELALRAGPVPVVVHLHESKRRMRFGERRVEL